MILNEKIDPDSEGKSKKSKTPHFGDSRITSRNELFSRNFPRELILMHI
jgi:hypothetical protein